MLGAPIRGALATALLSSLPLASAAADGTREFLTAPRVRHQIRLRFDNKRVAFDVDDDRLWRPLDPGSLFVTSTEIALTVHRLNPLAMQVTAGIEAAEDPAHADIALLLTALLQIPAIVSPGSVDARKAASAILGASGVSPEPGKRCTPVQRALDLLESLHNTLYSAEVAPETIASELATWTASIEAAPGAAGVHTARTAIADTHATMTRLIAAAQRSINDLVRRLDEDPAPADDACAAAERGIYEVIRLANPAARLADIRAIAKTMNGMTAALKRFDDPAVWRGEDYVLASVRPTADKLLNVTARSSALSYGIDDGSLTVTGEEGQTATLVLRYFTPFAIEIGLGAAFAFVDRPKYGTHKNARGDVTVASAGVDSVSVNPTVMVNFVCRCGGATIVEPMAQIGASTAKETPSIFFGGGIRLFGIGRGDFAIGGGAVVSWVRDLTKLDVGQTVGGTADIEKDLSFSHPPRVGSYMVLQYKF